MSNFLIKEYLNKICFIKDSSLYIDYRFFKHIANDVTYNFITESIVNSLKNILKTHETFYIHLSLKSLTLNDVDKHYSYITKICTLFKDEFPDKLQSCFIYNAPFIFTQVISIISLFIDKKTQKKISLLDNSEYFDK